MVRGSLNLRDAGAVAATVLLALLVARVATLPFHRWAARARVPRPAVPWVLLLLIAPVRLSWPGPHFRILMLLLLGLLSWQAISEDVDLGGDDPLGSERLFLAAAGVLAAFNPLVMLASLWVMLVRFQALKHHATLPVRLLFVGTAFTIYWAIAGAVRSQDAAPALIVMLASHGLLYFVPALTKAGLGPHWYSWARDNRLHNLMASAYSWGWARFIGEDLWCRVVRAAGRFDRPMQAAVFALEGAFLLEALHPGWARLLIAAAIVFHLAVFVASGILFWELMATNAALLWLLASADPAMIERAFGWQPCLWSGALMALFWKVGWPWRPFELGWWDTPFTQRVHRELVGCSGTIYGLYNDFLCPHERRYGQVHGSFMTQQKVCTFHLGEVTSRPLRDAIWAAAGAPEALENIKACWGQRHTDKRLAADERAYLSAFFAAFNAGRRKSVFPWALRWLKAPGGQCFYWGRRPGFRGQEQVSAVRLSYREEYFDGRRFVIIADEPLCEIAIPAPSLSPGASHFAQDGG
jgi:hypothetical protein